MIYQLDILQFYFTDQRPLPVVLITNGAGQCKCALAGVFYPYTYMHIQYYHSLKELSCLPKLVSCFFD